LGRLLGRLAEGRVRVEGFDLHLPVGPGLKLARPGLDHVKLEEAFRPQKVAELEGDRLRHSRAADKGGCEHRSNRDPQAHAGPSLLFGRLRLGVAGETKLPNDKW
jgi:hypothetical protein